MDTEQFLILAEEIAKEHPEDAMSVIFIEMCNQDVINERECLDYAGKIVLKHAS
jgi:hypothetical protein